MRIRASSVIVAVLGGVVLITLLVALRTDGNESKPQQADYGLSVKVSKEMKNNLEALKHQVDGMDSIISGLQQDYNNLAKASHNSRIGAGAGAGAVVGDSVNVLAPSQPHLQKDVQQDVVPQAKQGDTKAGGLSVVGSHTAKIRATGDTKGVCMLAQRSRTASTLEVEAMYDNNPFKNPHGGPWTQGWKVTYDNKQWSPSKKLNVFIIPHSHNDPGWIKTLDEYYRGQTSVILTKMIDKLSVEPSLKFVWAEISYLSMWWDASSTEMREKAKRLVQNGQLEIVTGGWVMPDEANSHYYAIVDQLVEGHQWVEQNLGVKPTSGWSIDPFGHSPTMAYILKKTGFKAMVIQRIHYEMKRMLAEKKHLEFMWRQDWDRQGDANMYTHMMPFFSYDAPHSCGPEPAICCQFDFARLPGFKYSCPWRIAPKPITSANVAERAHTLLDQYKKKAQLYATNNIFIPLGDDFRYDNQREIDAQVSNYKQLIEYMNSEPSLNVNVRFATLSDYFDSVYQETMGKPETALPTLSGDFFSYADKDDNYWTGYFTSRPFYKHLDRVLEAKLRGAEILFSLAQSGAVSHPMTHSDADLFARLTNARRALGLFQHHDGITGTAKDHVVVDYGNRMIKGINDADTVMADVLGGLLSDASLGNGAIVPTATRPSHDALPNEEIISVTTTPTRVVFYNSKAQRRKEIVSVVTNVADVWVTDSSEVTIVSQATLIWNMNTNPPTYATDRFRIWFEVELDPLAAAVYTIKAPPEMITTFDPPKHEFSSVTTYNFAPTTEEVSQITLSAGTESQSTLEAKHFSASVETSTGLVSSITSKTTGKTSKVKVEFVKYGAAMGSERSGAYLFMPDGKAKQHTTSASVVITKGPLVCEVQSAMSNVVHIARTFNTDSAQGAAVSITNQVDLRSLSNFELAMRVVSDVKNTDFYTDLNGFQLRRRKNYDKLPLQANFYPMPNFMFIQDSDVRVSLATRSAMGAAALSPGWMEVILDRRLMQDDKRGLMQGVKDNKKTELHLSLLVEPKAVGAQTNVVDNPTLLHFAVSDALNFPVESFLVKQIDADLTSSFSPLGENLPCDVHLLNLRSLAATRGSVGMILHRRGVACGTVVPESLQCVGSGEVDLKQLFAQHSITGQETSLTFMHELDHSLEIDSKVLLVPQELHAYKLTMQRKSA
eukprot:m.60599 g.60599  ORF g.60599 m.60599 type:complete len:1171 (+) comp11829_c0_seq2:109-3621(+)